MLFFPFFVDFFYDKPTTHYDLHVQFYDFDFQYLRRISKKTENKLQINKQTRKCHKIIKY